MTARPAFGLGFSLAFALGFNAGSDPLFPDTQEHNGISYDASIDPDNGGHVVVRTPGGVAQHGKLTDFFTFTRASTATYRGRDGLLKTASSGAPRVEAIGGTYAFAPHNYLPRSEQFGAAWGDNGGTVVENIAIAPNGTQTASVFRTTDLSGQGRFLAASSLVAGTTYTVSAFLRQVSGTGLVNFGCETNPANATASFNLLTNAVSSVGVNVVSTRITNHESGYKLCEVTFVATSTASTMHIYNDSTGQVSAGSNSFAVWGAAVQIGSVADRDRYVRTLTSVIPAVQTYENYRLGLLIENSRTNLALQSEDLSTSHATVGLNAVQTNVIAAPTGAVTADRISEDTGVTQHRIRQTTDVTIASGDSVAFSYFVKADQKTRVSLRITESTFASDVAAQFNLATGVLVGTSQLGVGSNQAGGIEFWGNGWYRIWVSGKINGGFLTARCLLELNDGAGSNTYTGDGVSGLYAFGEQIEAAAEFPSSYIATTTGTVTRNADACSRTLGTEFSAVSGSVIVYGQASPGQDAATGQVVWSFDDGTVNERIQATRPVGSNTMRFVVVDGGVTQVTIDNSIVNSARFSAFASWAANDFAAAYNGGAVGSDVSGSLPTTTTLGLGNFASLSQMNGHIHRFDYYPDRLPNALLQAMTA